MATTQNRDEYEQRLIDHEVRISRAREAVAKYQGGRESREERRSGAAEERWFRKQLVSMLSGAATVQDLEGLGVSDEVVREARLGESVAEAWARYHR